MIIFEKDSLSPDTWVNVWSIDWMNRAEFYCCCQISELDNNELDHYALEPVDENGIPIEAEKLQLNQEAEVGSRESETERPNLTETLKVFAY